MKRMAFVAAAALTCAAGPYRADTNWPCQQIKVVELSVGSFWSGPPLDLAADWQQSADVATLVGLVAQRRMSMPDARDKIEAFAQPPAQTTNAQLQLLFVGVFATLNRERMHVINGLDRFGSRQKDLAEGLRQDAEHLRAAQSSASSTPAQVSDLTQHLLWDQQVFEARRQTLRAACDLPTVIEQRLYGLGKVIQNILELRAELHG